MPAYSTLMKDSWLRACDICGRMVPFRQLAYLGRRKWACSDDRRMLTAEQIARHRAKPWPTFFGKPRKFPKQMANVGTYELAEGALFRLVSDYCLTASQVSMYGAITAAQTAVSAGSAGVYFGDIINSARPESWKAIARTKLVAVADYLLTLQYGSINGPSPAEATTSILFGGVLPANGGATFNTNDQSVAGLSFVRAYLLTANGKYLDAALRAAAYLRGLQRIDLKTTLYTATSSGGTTRLYVQGWSANINVTTKLISSVFEIAQAHCLRFLRELTNVVGGSTVVGQNTGGDFSGDWRGTLDTMMAEARAFYAAGTVANVGTSTKIAPLSAATPFQQYTAFVNGGGGTGLFSNNTSVAGTSQVGLGLRGLFEYEGYSASVAAFYELLMSFTSNPSFEAGANDVAFKTSDRTIAGVYDPNIALSSLDFTTNQNSTSIYGQGSAGLLAPIRIASDRDLFAAKEAADKWTAKTIDNGYRENLPLGSLLSGWGLGFQVPSAAIPPAQALLRVGIQTSAQFAEVYRFAPQAGGFGINGA